MENLKNKKVAILTETGFEESELLGPKKALEEAGCVVHVISPADSIQSWKDGDWGQKIPIDRKLQAANPADYDGVFIPGGVINPDKLRMNSQAVEFIKHFFENGKPVAAICHGPQVLIETGALQGRKMTSWPSLKTDLQNAGVEWVDEVCVVDGGLITSRKPDDLPKFNEKLLEELGEGVHEKQKTI